LAENLVPTLPLKEQVSTFAVLHLRSSFIAVKDFARFEDLDRDTVFAPFVGRLASSQSVLASHG
jgi:hypothetical protein